MSHSSPILISHRGNLNGRTDRENCPSQIDYAIDKGFMVEVDLWLMDSRLCLGHDCPSQIINEDFLEDRFSNLLIHAKNIEALDYLNCGFLHYFWHENDRYTLTSQGIILAYPGMSCPDGGLAMKCEEWPTINPEWWGICSDIITEYK
jgi:hypothetical protein